MHPPPGGYRPPHAAHPAHKPITGSPETMALHAMTIDPKTGLPKGERPPASAAAVLSLVCGMLLCLGPITGVSAIASGIVARSQAKSKPHAVGGATMAAWGIALGALNLVMSSIAALLWALSMLSE
jgi:hypothetical protein